MKIHLVLFFFLLVFFSRPAHALLDDIYLIFDENIEFGNDRIALIFDSRSGAWTSLRFNECVPIISTESPGVEFILQNEPAAPGAVEFLGHSVRFDPQRNGVILQLSYLVPPGIEMVSCYQLFPHSARVHRFATACNASSSSHQFWGFLFDLPNVTLGDPQYCVLNVPGPWFPKSYIGSDKPYLEMLDKDIMFHGAPEAGFGFVSLTNTEKNYTLATWMVTGAEVNYNPIIRGDGRRLTLRMKNNRQYRLQPHMMVESDVQVIEFVQGDVTDAASSYRQMIEETLPLGEAPLWVKNAVILEVYPPYFKNGFADITKKLPFYKEIGFTCIYLMPHWKGGYSPINLYEVNPEYGTRDELQELVKTAHDLDMKVLFDMVIHGMNEKSPLMEERPELFCKNEQGDIVRHPTWRSKTFDWANPDYQQYMVDLVLHDLETYNIDGYRVDAASYKGPNWDPTIPYPAYRSGAAAPELMSKMLNALQSQKPDAVLLSEVFGPAFHHVCNFVHDNQTEACQMLIEKIEAGEATAHTYQQHLDQVFSLLPPGANRVIYTRNHDTSWFYHFNGYTPRFLAFEAINALCGIPEIFAGDPNNGPNPDEDPDTWHFYKKLFELRNIYSPLVYGIYQPKTVQSSNPMVFTAIKEYQGQRCLVLVSLDDEPVETTLALDNFAGATLSDMNGHVIHLTQPQLTVQPFQVLVGPLN